MCLAKTKKPTTSHMQPAILAGLPSPTQITVQNRKPSAGRTTSSEEVSAPRVRPVHPEFPDDGQVDSHEAQKCAKVQKLRGQLITDHLGADKAHDAKQNNVDIRGIADGMEPGKIARRNHILPAHAEEQSCRPYLGSKPRTYIGHHQ